MGDSWFILILGLVVGVATAGVLFWLLRSREGATAARWVERTQAEKEQEVAAIFERAKAEFASLSRAALSANIDDFFKLAKSHLGEQLVQGEQTLETKKKLIDARLEEMGLKLGDLNRLVQALEKQRAETHGSLTTQIERATQATNRLHETTAKLREALANPQRRGQWGERMAEDVLRLAGFQAGISYRKQEGVADGRRPDFTFPLPGGRCVHMDVKFPLANYLKVLEAADERARADGAKQFLRDVRARIREVTTRDYIDPAAGTVDYVLVFIPNEQIYGFIHEQDGSLMDEALRSKVVLCSPITLYAILAVIRQAVEQFRLEQGSRQVLEVLAEFRKQWGKYVDSMEGMGRKLEEAMQKYEELVKVRTRQLDRQLDKLDTLSAPGELLPQGAAAASSPDSHNSADR